MCQLRCCEMAHKTQFLIMGLSVCSEVSKQALGLVSFMEKVLGAIILNLYQVRILGGSYTLELGWGKNEEGNCSRQKQCVFKKEIPESRLWHSRETKS